MKIIQINNVYDYGSTGRITRDIHHTLLNNNYESLVYYGRKYKTKDINTYKICSEQYAKLQKCFYLISGIKYSGCYYSTKKLIKELEKEKADIVHLQCLNGHFVNIYRLINYLKDNSIPTVLTLHAEFMYTGGCGHAIDCTQWCTESGCGQKLCPLYKKELKSMMGDRSSLMWKKMKNAFNGFQNIIVASVSPWLMNRAKKSEILGDKKHVVIYNGLDCDCFHPYSRHETEIIKNKLGIENNKKIVFHATPSFDNNPQNIKGGHYIIKLAEQMKDTCFVVAGHHDSSLRAPANILMLGNITDKNTMAKLYAMADVTVLTSKRETFSMVCAESQCCGTPVVGFQAGAPELISLPEYSSFCAFGDINKMKELIEKWFVQEKNYDQAKKAIVKFNKERMTNEYISIYLDIMKKQVKQPSI